MHNKKFNFLAPVALLLVALLFVYSCKKDEDDTTPPGPVTDLTASPGDSEVTLGWTEPTDADLLNIEISISPGSYLPITVIKGTSGGTITGLTNGTLYTFSVVTIDGDGNRSAAVTADAKPNVPLVITAPNQADYNAYGPPTFTLDGTGHAKINITFNRAINVSTLVGGQTVYIQSGTNIVSGGITYDTGTNTATFTSTQPIADWCSFSPDCTFKFIVVGTDAGQGAVLDTDGMHIDGDEDDTPGGNYELTLTVIG
ncbi:MAG: fibronectin type III domain-containing protein [Bacteroidales bacterium]|nr:fibronectin type III domain-containing protein [Bacteroidales bacterium]